MTTSERLPDGRYTIPAGTSPQSCRGCGAAIYWVRTPAGKSMPCDPNGAPHWGTCPKEKQFTRRGAK